MYMYIHVLMRDEKEGRSKQGQRNNKAKQHNTHTRRSHVRLVCRDVCNEAGTVLFAVAHVITVITNEYQTV